MSTTQPDPAPVTTAGAPESTELEAEHALVASRVTGALLADVPEAVTYGDHAGAETAQRRHELRILYEQWNPDVIVHMRALGALSQRAD